MASLRRLPAALGLSLLLVAGATGLRAQESTEEPFEERVDVIERMVLVDIPPGVSKQPGDLTVVEQGIRREVVAVDPTEPGDWRVLVYFDSLRTPPEMVFRGALQLARRSGELTELGGVEVVDSRPEGVEILGETREPARLMDLAAQVAQRAAEARDAEASRVPEEDRASDRRLEAAVESRCAAPPCLLILVSDGYSAESAAAGLEGADLGKRLSGFGWTVMVLPLLEHDPDQPAVPDSTGQKTEGILDLPPVFRVWPWSPRRARGAGQPLSTLDALTEPRWEPLRQWADATGGWLVRHQDEFPELLNRLGDRYLVVYRVPVPEPSDEAAPEWVPLEVEASESGRTFEAPSWVRPARRTRDDPSD